MNLNELTPDIKVSIKQTFGIESEMKVDGFSKKNEHKTLSILISENLKSFDSQTILVKSKWFRIFSVQKKCNMSM